MLKPTNILVPTDFSEYSDKALLQAVDIARQYSSKVYLVHVVHELIQQCVVDSCISGDIVLRLEDEMMELAKTNMAAQLDRIPHARELGVIGIVRRGVPYEEILREADENGIDLIVIASLGRTGLAKYLIGSVARNVLRESKCPVLLTK